MRGPPRVRTYSGGSTDTIDIDEDTCSYSPQGNGIVLKVPLIFDSAGAEHAPSDLGDVDVARLNVSYDEFDFYRNLFRIVTDSGSYTASAPQSENNDDTCGTSNSSSSASQVSSAALMSLLMRSNLTYEVLSYLVGIVVKSSLTIGDHIQVNLHQFIVICKLLSIAQHVLRKRGESSGDEYAYIQSQCEEIRRYCDVIPNNGNSSGSSSNDNDEVKVEAVYQPMIPLADFAIGKICASFKFGKVMTSFRATISGYSVGDIDGAGAFIGNAISNMVVAPKRIVRYKITTSFYDDDASGGCDDSFTEVMYTKTVHRRYSEFCYLVSVLQRLYRGLLLPPLPPKSYAGSDSKVEELAVARAAELQLFADRLCRHPALSKSYEVLLFLSAPSRAFHALQGILSRSHSHLLASSTIYGAGDGAAAAAAHPMYYTVSRAASSIVANGFLGAHALYSYLSPQKSGAASGPVSLAEPGSSTPPPAAAAAASHVAATKADMDRLLLDRRVYLRGLRSVSDSMVAIDGASRARMSDLAGMSAHLRAIADLGEIPSLDFDYLRIDEQVRRLQAAAASGAEAVQHDSLLPLQYLGRYLGSYDELAAQRDVLYKRILLYQSVRDSAEGRVKSIHDDLSALNKFKQIAEDATRCLGEEEEAFSRLHEASRTEVIRFDRYEKSHAASCLVDFAKLQAAGFREQARVLERLLHSLSEADGGSSASAEESGILSKFV